MSEIITAAGLIMPAPFTEMEGKQRELYEGAVQGQCMTCHSTVGVNALVMLTSTGILGIFCGGTCASDMQVLGWIQEQHDDLIDKINFRGGDDGNRGDEAEA